MKQLICVLFSVALSWKTNLIIESRNETMALFSCMSAAFVGSM